MSKSSKSSKKIKAQKPALFCEKLTETDKREVIRMCAHNNNFAGTLEAILPLQEISAIDRLYGRVLETIFRLRQELDRLPHERELQQELERKMHVSPESFSDSDIATLEDLFNDVYTPNAFRQCNRTPALEENALKLAKNWALASTNVSLVTALNQGLRSNIDPEQAIARFQEVRKTVSTIDAPLVDALFPQGQLEPEEATERISTGIIPWDRFTNGGLLGGEVFMFMGPFGSCKTTCAVQSCAIKAREYAHDFARGEVRLNSKGQRMRPVVVFASFEAPKDEFRRRLIACLATVPHERLTESRGDMRFFHDNPEPTEPYELEEIREQAAMAKVVQHSAATNPLLLTYVSERKRIQRAIDIVNRHVVFLEFLPSNERLREFGGGGLEDVHLVMQRQFSTNEEMYPALSIVDHLSAVVNRMIEKGRIDRSEQEQELNAQPGIGSRYIAKFFKIPLILNHQLSADANKRARNPSVVLHHTDAKGSGSVAEYADFSVQVTAPTEDVNQFAVMHCTKKRRTGVSPPAIVRVRGAVCRIDDYTHAARIAGNSILKNVD